MRSVYKRSKSNGFTLIEIMVALLLGAIMIAPMYAITRAMSRQAGAQQMEVESMQRARTGLSTMMQDFSRAGMSVSPNTFFDPLSESKYTGMTAQNRKAVVHLNSGGLYDKDAVILSGDFLGNRSYQAIVTGSGTILINPSDGDADAISPSECTRCFDPNFAFAHVVNKDGHFVDARVTAVAAAGNGCTVTVDPDDLSILAASQEFVSVSSNQTVLYITEQVADTKGVGGFRTDLVRYFVDYDATGPLTCRLDASGVIQNSPLTADRFSRQVIASYVEEFEVWFRTVTPSTVSTSMWFEPHSMVNGAGNCSEGLLPDRTSGDFSAYGFTSTNYGFSGASLTCTNGTEHGPEHVRSAMILLSVRSERGDPNLNFKDLMGTGANYNMSFHVSSVDTDTSAASEKPGSAYKLSTLVTEVEMPNLASRIDVVKSRNINAVGP